MTSDQSLRAVDTLGCKVVLFVLTEELVGKAVLALAILEDGSNRTGDTFACKELLNVGAFVLRNGHHDLALLVISKGASNQNGVLKILEEVKGEAVSP